MSIERIGLIVCGVAIVALTVAKVVGCIIQRKHNRQMNEWGAHVASAMTHNTGIIVERLERLEREHNMTDLERNSVGGNSPQRDRYN